MAKWVDGFAPALITQRIEKTKSITTDGSTSFSGFEHTDNVAILTSMLNLNREIPEVECSKIINKAIFIAGAKGAISSESILREVSSLESAYLGQSMQPFRLITSLSLVLPLSPKIFNIGASRISIGWRANRKTAMARSEVIQSARSTVSGDLPSLYTPVAITVTARSKNEAATKALDDLDLLRAIWNLWKNRAYKTRISSGARSPVNAIILGPIHTLHKLNGERATDAWWYEPGYRGPINVWRDASCVPSMFIFTKSFRNRLRNLPYQEEIVSALIRYTRALDSRDWNYTFLQLWSVLEQLTGTTQQESHKVTVKRASFVFADTDYALQTLLHLRAYRNKSIHTGAEAENVEPLMYQLKQVIEALLIFHAGRSGKFQTMTEAAEFMDSPSDRASVDAKISKLQAVRKFLVA